MALTDKLTAIGDAIRSKTGSTDTLTLDQMATTIKAIETDSMDFEIVGGTTQPTNPKENTIWINTNTVISDYQISYWQPTQRLDGTPLQTGDVWINVSADRAYHINLLTKYGANVPVYAIYQYNGTSYIELITNNNKLFQNGEWIDIVNYIYSKGSHLVTPKTSLGSSSVAKSSVTQNTSNISMYAYHHVYCAIYWYVDLTDIKTLSLNVTSVSGSSDWYNWHYLGISTVAVPFGENWIENNAKAYQRSQSKGVLTLDVSNYSGYHYVFVANRTSGDYVSRTIVFDQILCK